MIIVDENLHDHRIMEAISAWYPGQVVSVATLRPGTVIKDAAIPALLLKAVQPTFVTTNVTDFWKRVQPHSGYCIIAMGKVIRLAPNRIRYYEPDRRVHSLPWPS